MNFITPAFAQAAGGSPGGSEIIMQMAPFAIILVIMYFLIIRPQQKRAKETQDMLGSIRRGDTVVTAGGIIGKVTKVTDAAEVYVRAENLFDEQYQTARGYGTSDRAFYAGVAARF